MSGFERLREFLEKNDLGMYVANFAAEKAIYMDLSHLTEEQKARIVPDSKHRQVLNAAIRVAFSKPEKFSLEVPQVPPNVYIDGSIGSVYNFSGLHISGGTVFLGKVVT